VEPAPAETAFLAAAAARLDELDGGLAWLASEALGLGWPIGVALGLAGLWLFLDAVRRRHLLGAAGGAALGALAALAARQWIGSGLPLASVWALAAAGGAGGAVLGAAAPTVVSFAAGALPGAVLGAAVEVGGSRLAGLVAGAAALGVPALIAAEATRVLLAAGMGALAAGLAGLTLASDWGARPLAQDLAAHPHLLLAWVAVLTVVGAAGWLPRPAGARRDRPVTPDPMEDP